MLRRYYTIQKIEAWEEAQQKGYLEGNKNYVYEEFLKAYLWMMNQMRKKLSLYNGEYPVWLWLERPDLRCGGYLNPGEKGVLLEIYIDEERVLLSDFYLWHCVLNNDAVADDEDEWELIRQGKSHITIEQSWERIFDVNYDSCKNTIIQGVTGKISIDKIRLIKEFIAKNIGI